MVALAEITQETNSFNPVAMTLDAFRLGGLHEGKAMLSSLSGKWSLDGVLDVFGLEDTAEPLIPIISAHALSGGKITDDCLSYYGRKLAAGMEGLGGEDTAVIALHGAMSSESIDDADGWLLGKVRDVVGPDLYIVLVLDHHANVTHEMMAAADLIIGYETQPHDQCAAGRKAAKTLLRVKQEKLFPASAWRKIPMIAPQDRFLTTINGPMQEWFDLARDMEKQTGVLAVSLFPMQPWLDVEQGGWAVVVYTTGDKVLADKIADEMASAAWRRREEFWKSDRVSPAEAVRLADQEKGGLVVISDTGDAVLGGATGDSTILLKEMLRGQIRSTAFVPLVDLPGVTAAHQAGVGRHVVFTVGATIDAVFNSPVEIRGVVSALSNNFKAQTPWGSCQLGRTALIESGSIKLVLTEYASFATNHPSIYTHLGLKMENARMVVLKTGSNFQNFSKWQTKLIRADTEGITQSRLQNFSWQKLPRPIFPFDSIKNWR